MHVAINTRTSYLKDMIKEENITYEIFQEVKASLQQQGTTHKFEHYKLDDVMIKYKNKVYISNSENVQKMVLKEMQDLQYAGHYGYQKIVAVVKKDYYWPRMKKEITNYILHAQNARK